MAVEGLHEFREGEIDPTDQDVFRILQLIHCDLGTSLGNVRNCSVNREKLPQFQELARETLKVIVEKMRVNVEILKSNLRYKGVDELLKNEQEILGMLENLSYDDLDFDDKYKELEKKYKFGIGKLFDKYHEILFNQLKPLYQSLRSKMNKEKANKEAINLSGGNPEISLDYKIGEEAQRRLEERNR